MRTGWALLALAWLAIPARAVADEPSDAQFSREELARLGRGELVARPLTERGAIGVMVGGTSWQVIDASPEVVLQALLDTRHYQRRLPQVSEARLVRDDGDARTVFVKHRGLIVKPSYYIALQVDRDQRGLKFHVDESKPRSIARASGFYALRPYAGHRTLLVYGVMADLGDGLLTAIVRGSVHEWMLKVPLLVKRFVEGSGRYLYKPAVPAALADAH